MHKTPDEIKTGGEFCTAKVVSGNLKTCDLDCPYRVEGVWCRNALAHDTLEYIQQLEAKVPRWISVEDDKPKEYENVNVYVAGDDGCRYTSTGFYDGKHWRGYGNRFDVVTHWAKLPKPPEEE